MVVQYKKSVPSTINKKFKNKKIDAAFISSIKSKNQKCTNLGIISYKEVYSVFVLPNKAKEDAESDTSNALAKVLGLSGEVTIGDKALKLYLNNSNLAYQDLSLQWYKKTKLPFVFARLCYNKHGKQINKLTKKFNTAKTKIPQYYLKKAAKQKGLTANELQWYLKYIYYNINYKEQASLKLFLKKAKKHL